uniref:Uncharacterized protein n=1 Tax=Peronospora matthiolae TaxID=2874970 RepID=A0AAV1U5S3_9STRA
MRIYTTELLAAVAFIESLSRYSASGSKTLRPDLRSSDHPKDPVKTASDNRMLPSNDGANGEDRTFAWESSELSAVLERAQEVIHDQIVPMLAAQDRNHVALGRAGDQMHVHDIPYSSTQGWDRLRHAHDAPERLESSGTVATPVLDLPSLAEKEQAPVVASQSEADSTRVNEHSPGVASRLEADSTRINELLIADGNQVDAYRKRAIERALAVAAQPNDKRTSIIEQLQQQTDDKLLSPDQWKSLKKGKRTQNWTAEQLMQDLVGMYGANTDGFTKLATALRKAKVADRNDEMIFTALEAAMLESWKNRGIAFDRSPGLLELSDLTGERDMMDNKLRLLHRYLFVSPDGHHGGRYDVYRYLFDKLKSEGDYIYLRTLAQAGQSTIVDGMLMYYVNNAVSHMSPTTMINRMHAAQISESTGWRMLSNIRQVAQAQENYEGKFRWTNIAKALQTGSDNKWKNYFKKALGIASSNPSANNSKRKEGTFSTYEAALALSKEDPKRQKTAGPSIRR